MKYVSKIACVLYFYLLNKPYADRNQQPLTGWRGRGVALPSGLCGLLEPQMELTGRQPYPYTQQVQGQHCPGGLTHRLTRRPL